MQLQCLKDQENAVERNDNNQNNNQHLKDMTETISQSALFFKDSGVPNALAFLNVFFGLKR